MRKMIGSGMPISHSSVFFQCPILPVPLVEVTVAAGFGSWSSGRERSGRAYCGLTLYAARNMRVALSITSAMRSAEGEGAA